MTTYKDNSGRSIDIDEDTVKDLESLAHITRETTAMLAARAVEQLRRELVPSAGARRSPVPAATGQRGRRSASGPTQVDEQANGEQG